MKTESPPAPYVTLRVPGPWRALDELAARLPDAFRIDSGRALCSPLGPRLGFRLGPADQEFPDVFRIGLRRKARRSELRGVARYRHNACLVGHGGSLELARWLLQAGAALLEAGGHGVFIDNSGLSHGAADWQELSANRRRPMAVYYSFIRLFRMSQAKQYASLGMHVFGHRDALLRSVFDCPERLVMIEDFVRDTVCRQRQWKPNDRFRDENGNRCRIELSDDGESLFEHDPGHPMFNPYGHWRLVPLG